MTSPRTFLASIALATLAALGASAPALAAEPAPGPRTGTRIDISVGEDGPTFAKRCRWVKRIGLVCDTENGTITL